MQPCLEQSPLIGGRKQSSWASPGTGPINNKKKSEKYINIQDKRKKKNKHFNLSVFVAF